MTLNHLELKKIGRYPVRRFIRAGGMAWVYEVQDPTFEGFEVVRALKLLKPDAAAGDEFQRFQREAGLLAQIDHAHLIKVYDFGRDEQTGCFYYTMTYIEGQENVEGPAMSDFIAKYGRLSLEDACRILRETLSALGELHDRGIIHRDIKPGNILIDANGSSRLADLGIVRMQAERGATRTGTAIGTVLYMSPEQARGRPVDAASDIFSVGLTFFQALTGEMVYDRVDDLDSTSQHDVLGYLVSLARTGESLELHFPPELDVPEPLQEVLRQAVQYKPEDRFADAKAMSDALDKALYDVVEVPAGATSRWPLFAALGGTVALAAAVAGYFAWNIWAEERATLALAAEVEPLRTEASAILERVKDFEETAGTETLATIEDAMRQGETRWSNAQEDIKEESWHSAQGDLVRARGFFVGACDQLGKGRLPERAATEMKKMNERVGGLRVVYDELVASGDASESVQRTWGELDTRVGELSSAPEGDGCAKVGHWLDQIDGVGASLVLVKGVETELASVAPRIADAARTRAERAKRTAEADRIDAREYRAEIAEGDKLRATGDRLALEDPLKARDLYDQATERYESARAVVPAVAARDRVSGLERKMGGDAMPSKASRLVSEGHTAFAARRWSEATRSYEQAAALMVEGLDKALLRSEADQQLATAREEKRQAQKAGADQMAKSTFDRAAGDLSAGEAAYAQGDYKEAGERFAAAAQGFKGSLVSATDSLGAAQQAKREAHDLRAASVGDAGCSKVEPSSARSTCTIALNSLEMGDQALRSDPDAAVKHYQGASASFRRVTRLVDEWERSRPRPPVITARSPKRAAVEIFRGAPLRLGVSVRDPNDDERLTYAWSFNGKPTAGDGDTLDFTPPEAGSASVTVTDSTGNTVDASWTISFKNRPPELAVTPRGNVTIQRGGTQLFKVEASDPDGTPLETTFKLDGALVASGKSSYEFTQSKPGTYELVVTTRDADGESTSERRRITVRNLAPRLTLEHPRALQVDPNEPLTFTAKVSDPEGTAVTTRFKLDGKPVGQSRTYTFAKTEPGEYQLEVVASDVDGASTSERRTITVLRGDVFHPPRAEWERELQDTLRTYKAALEGKDIRKLEQVWRFERGFNNKGKWQRKFKQYKDIGIRLNVESAEELRGDMVDVKFQQAESLDGRERTYEVQTTFLRRAAGWQIIKYRRKILR